MEDFLRNPSKYPLDHHLCHMIRNNQSFLPEAVTTSCELALQVLETNHGNLICGYHQKAKGAVLVDGEGKYMLNRQPYPWNFRKSSAHPPVKRPDGHFHCGCNEDVALMDFFLENMDADKQGGR
jgi:hypothetical protein